jgi:Protein of unknown function (DUF2950)
MKMKKSLFAIVLLSVCGAAFAGPAKNFKAPEAAAEAFEKIVEARDHAAMEALLGDGWRDVIPEDGVEEAKLDKFVEGYKARHSIQLDGNRAKLAVGEGDWTLPIPLAKGAHGWHFDTVAGAEEIRARDIGRNEENAIKSAQAYFDAQLDYAGARHDGSPVAEYAQRFLSTASKHDGLYWEAAAGGPGSPLGPYFSKYPLKENADAYYGYHFRILTAQGAHAPGGARDYVVNGHMTLGFALVAWPETYGDTGVMTFMIGSDGRVYQRDFGADTDKAVAAITKYDPDTSWEFVDASHIDEN